MLLGGLALIQSGCFLGRFTPAGREARREREQARLELELTRARRDRLATDSAVGLETMLAERQAIAAASYALAREQVLSDFAAARMQGEDSLAATKRFQLDSIAAEQALDSITAATRARATIWAQRYNARHAWPSVITEPATTFAASEDPAQTEALQAIRLERDRYQLAVAARDSALQLAALRHKHWQVDANIRKNSRETVLRELENRRTAAERIVREAMSMRIQRFSSFGRLEEKICVVGEAACRSADGRYGVRTIEAKARLEEAQRAVVQLIDRDDLIPIRADLSEFRIDIAPDPPRTAGIFNLGAWTSPDRVREAADRLLARVRESFNPPDHRLVELHILSNPDGVRFAVRTKGGYVQRVIAEARVPNLWRGIYELTASMDGYEPASFSFDLITDPRTMVECQLRKSGSRGLPSRCRPLPMTLPKAIR